MSLYDQDDARERAAGFVLVLVIGVLGALALVHWLQPCSPDAAALCLGPMLVRLQHLRWRWADRAWQTLRALALRVQLGWEEDALANLQYTHDLLPLELEAQRRRVNAMCMAVALAEAAARGDA